MGSEQAILLLTLLYSIKYLLVYQLDLGLCHYLRSGILNQLHLQPDWYLVLSKLQESLDILKSILPDHSLVSELVELISRINLLDLLLLLLFLLIV